MLPGNWHAQNGHLDDRERFDEVVSAGIVEVRIIYVSILVKFKMEGRLIELSVKY
jgi:hypothetical protein